MKAWLFDVDGVLTNPQEKKIVESKIIEFLIKILSSGELIGLNTGRSLGFVEKEVLEPLQNQITNKEYLNRIFFAGEKGGTWGKFQNGKIEEFIDDSLKMPEELISDVKEVLSKYEETTFFDDTKRTMISTEFIKGADFSKFQEDQKNLTEDLKSLLIKHNLKNLILEPSIIATDIQYPSAGKDLGVERFLEMIKDKEEPTEFETFGDSPSDIEMFKYLERKGHNARFIYVGEKEIEEGERIIKTKSKFDKGTLEYLEGLN
jgi:hydroxymethylpyrimidine pyrophosphatase-like HAD family hydrolase